MSGFIAIPFNCHGVDYIIKYNEFTNMAIIFRVQSIPELIGFNELAKIDNNGVFSLFPFPKRLYHENPRQGFVEEVDNLKSNMGSKSLWFEVAKACTEVDKNGVLNKLYNVYKVRTNDGKKIDPFLKVSTVPMTLSMAQTFMGKMTVPHYHQLSRINTVTVLY